MTTADLSGRSAFDEKRLTQALQARDSGDTQPLEALCREVLQTDPNNRMAHATLCQILCQRNEYQVAADLVRDHLQVVPDDPYAHMNLAHCLIGLKQYAPARDHARHATTLFPEEAKAWVNLASACYHLEAYEEGIAACQRALELNPDDARALNNLATLSKAQGRLPEAVEIYRRAKNLDPTSAVCYTNLMLALMYDETVDVRDILAEAKDFAEQFEKPVIPLRRSHHNTAQPERRLKVGFISPDLCSHSVMYFAEPVITRLPRQQFEIYCYYTHVAGDFVTDRIKALADVFRHVPDTDPRAAAETIQNDGIDILIDLAGHTTRSGLRAMAFKPAPVQVTWLGYPGSTGLSCVDWRITDHIADPPGADAFYTEKLVRLPGCFAVYRPHIRNPLQRFAPAYQVSNLPALREGFITFGSCNNIAKVSRSAIMAWADVLKRVPNSRMLIEGKDLDSPVAASRLRQEFERVGIGADRLWMVQRDSRRQYLTYHDIDICLDTYPLTGGTTTFDALWMGVPVVSRYGRTFRERLSATIIVNGGYADDVCKSHEAYVDRAVALAEDLEALRRRRSEQRAQILKSALMDEQAYVSRFAQALRMIWREWCRAKEPQGLVANPGAQDVLIEVNGGRVSLPHAEAWLQRLLARIDGQDRHADPKSARALAVAILQVIPEHRMASDVAVRLSA